MAILDYMNNLSVSNVNGFLEYRSKWFLQYIYKIKFSSSSPDMARGNAVEHGIFQAITGNADEELAKNLAVNSFTELTGGVADEVHEEYRASIPELVSVGIGRLEGYGKPIAVQRKINHILIEDLPIEWIGYADLVFEGGIVVDLKVTGRTPSEMPDGHSRQGAFYQKAIPDAKEAHFLYLVPLKRGINAVTHIVKDNEKHLNHLKQGALAMDRALSLGGDKEALKHFFYPNPSDWWLKDEEALNHAKSVWKI